VEAYFNNTLGKGLLTQTYLKIIPREKNGDKSLEIFQNISQHVTRLLTSNFRIKEFLKFSRIPVDSTRACDVKYHPNTYK